MSQGYPLPAPLPPLSLRHRRAATRTDEQLAPLRSTHPHAHARSASASANLALDTRPVFSRTQQQPIVMPVHQRSPARSPAAASQRSPAAPSPAATASPSSDVSPSSVESATSSPSAPTPHQHQQQAPTPKGPLSKLMQPVLRACDVSSPLWPYTYIHDDDNIWTGFVTPMFNSDEVRAALKVPEAAERPQYCVAVLRSYISRKLGRTNANVTAPKVTAKIQSLEVELIESDNRIHLARAFAQVRDEYAFGDSPVAPVRVRQLPHWRMRSISRSASQPITDADYVDDDDYILSVAPSYAQASDAGMEAQLAKYRKLKKFVKSAHRHVLAANEREREAEAKAAAAQEEVVRLAKRVARLEAAALGQQAFPLVRRGSSDSVYSQGVTPAAASGPAPAPACTPAEAAPAALSMPTVPAPVTIVPLAEPDLGPEEVITTPLSSPVFTPSDLEELDRSLYGTPGTASESLPSATPTSPRTPATAVSELPSPPSSSRPLPRPPADQAQDMPWGAAAASSAPDAVPPPRPARRKEALPNELELPPIPRFSVFSLSTMLQDEHD
ncbi:hypothetical protein Q8F55_008240 [Vanrija albida]|uniref:Uncharacterized protein n=1 Tax=Vanrija albida TaxID=181172 RepID=A0ABR3PVV0_9TREE